MNHVHFLLVDDEKEFVDTLAKRLRQRGYSADCAYSGQAALDRLDQKAGLIDVILLGIQMPEIDGIQTLELLKRKHPLPEVIMLTGHASVGSAVEALKSGAFDYLTKPCDLNEVISKAEQAVSRKKGPTSAAAPEWRPCGPTSISGSPNTASPSCSCGEKAFTSG
ncbi:MAG: response regulator [Thermodesulfobacteriota bacterium]